MLKTVAKLEHKIGERMYHFLCDNDAPLSDVKECLFQFLKFIGHVEDQAKAAAESAKPQEEKEEPKEVEIV